MDLLIALLGDAAALVIVVLHLRAPRRRGDAIDITLVAARSISVIEQADEE